MQKVRIIAGSLRGRNVVFPDQENLRPTLSRVRETMFAWLEPYIYGANCLDLFAGSGAMGFEAVSRGAKQVLMVDQSPQVIEYIRRNQANFGVDNIELLQGSYLTLVSQIKQYAPFDLVFIDPPFLNNELENVLKWLAENDFLQNNSMILCEWGLQSAPNFPTMYITKKLKKAGKVNYGLFGYENLGK